MWLKTGDVYPPPWEPQEPILSLISWVGDTIGHEFIDPEDWPELPPSVVEDVNRPYRAVTNRRHAVMTSTGSLDNDLWAAADYGYAMMCLVEKLRAKPGRTASVRHLCVEVGRVFPPE